MDDQRGSLTGPTCVFIAYVLFISLFLSFSSLRRLVCALLETCCTLVRHFAISPAFHAFNFVGVVCRVVHIRVWLGLVESQLVGGHPTFSLSGSVSGTCVAIV